jgi:hypothetical protein
MLAHTLVELLTEKSTLMEAVRNTDRLASHHVHVTVPVKYESGDCSPMRRRRSWTKSGHSIESCRRWNGSLGRNGKLYEASGQVDHVTHAGLALLAYIKHAPADERRWEQPPDDWKPTIEALAAAMAVRAEPAAIREEALRDAVNPVTST